MRAVRAISCVPIASPEASRDSTSASRPLAITVLAPLCAARLAARILVSMPPRPEARTRAARHRFEVRRAGIGLLNKRGVGILARVGGEKTVLIGEDDERVAFDQICDERAERVVIAELDFVGDDGVVFVDDRHHAETQQA